MNSKVSPSGNALVGSGINHRTTHIIITLGAEVAGILQGVKGNKKRNDLLGGDMKEVEIGNKVYRVIHFAHPGIVMRNTSERNPWPKRHREVNIPDARNALKELFDSSY